MVRFRNEVWQTISGTMVVTVSSAPVGLLDVQIVIGRLNYALSQGREALKLISPFNGRRFLHSLLCPDSMSQGGADGRPRGPARDLHNYHMPMLCQCWRRVRSSSSARLMGAQRLGESKRV